MAKNNSLVSLCTLLFLVFIILSHQILPIEARNLKCKKCRGHVASNSRHMHAHTPPSSSQPPLHLFKATNSQPLMKKDEITNKKIETLDDFRPTTPGRSPGAGHQNQNQLTVDRSSKALFLMNVIFFYLLIGLNLIVFRFKLEAGVYK